MSKEVIACGICGRPVTEEEGALIKFPNGEVKLAHISHPGVKEEIQYTK